MLLLAGSRKFILFELLLRNKMETEDGEKIERG